MSELKIYCDGGSRGNPGPGASAFVIFNESGKEIARVGKFLGNTTNNQAEYQAVIFALEFVQKMVPHPLGINFLLDSELIVRQMTGEYRIKNPGLQKLAVALRVLEKQIGARVTYCHIPRSKNKLADFLVNHVLNAGRNIG